MYDNVRLFFSALWLIALGATLASLLAVLVSWGDHLEYLVASVLVLGAATAGTVATSL